MNSKFDETSEIDLEEIKTEFPTFYELIRATVAGLKNSKRQKELDAYDPQVVEDALRDWKNDTGCFVHLSEEQKIKLYEELLRRNSETILMTTSAQMTKWFEKQDIPFIPIGTVRITVDPKKSQILCNAEISLSDGQMGLYSHAFTIDDEHRCDEQLKHMTKELSILFESLK